MSAAPLVHELTPCPDPWDVARKLAHLPHLCFLDSSERGDRGRYSYVMANPFGTAATKWTGCEQMARSAPRVATLEGLPPFQGGYAGFLGYELGRQFDRMPQAQSDEFEYPPFGLFWYDWVVSFDHHLGRAWAISTGDVGIEWPGQEKRAADRLRGLLAALTLHTIDESHYLPPSVNSTAMPVSRHPLPHHPGVTSNFSRDGYIDAVRRAVEYVHAGDVFQVNISQRLLAPLTEHPLELYGRLRQTSPSPFGCYLDLGDFQILSSSPERFLQLSANGEVSTRPIKGTRPRGKTPAEDAALLRDLVTNPKDRAENVMIVDLLRNDLGRVCEYGSVKVPAVCEVESFRHVHHLVSEVRGKLRPGLTAFDLLRAAFPGGSVTGAPKVRAMEIIAELEPTARGPYCGSVGWIGFDGAMDTNILIRTFTAGRGWVQFPVGGGIVADSDPATEYEETLHKAAGMLRALK
jgi:para-aminobenzoate synthetase component 1